MLRRPFWAQPPFGASTRRMRACSPWPSAWAPTFPSSCMADVCAFPARARCTRRPWQRARASCCWFAPTKGFPPRRPTPPSTRRPSCQGRATLPSFPRLPILLIWRFGTTSRRQHAPLPPRLARSWNGARPCLELPMRWYAAAALLCAWCAIHTRLQRPLPWRPISTNGGAA